MSRVLTYLLILVFCATTAKENKFNIVFRPVTKVRPPLSITGFSRIDINFDTRQVIPALGEFGIFFPVRKTFDVNGNDIAAQGRFDMLAIQSVLQIVTHIPDLAGGKAVAAVEGYFVATSVFALFQLRHAATRITWEEHNFVLTFGQYWHPMFVPWVSPNTVSLARGIPIALISRNPQLTGDYTWTWGDWTFNILGSMLTQGAGNLSDGPFGFAGLYARNSVMPDMCARIIALWKGHIFGGAVDVKRLRPRLVSNNNFKVNERLISVAGTLFAEFNWDYFSISTKANIGENMANFNMISGYAVHSVDPVTDARTYANTRVAAAWLDINISKFKVQPGLFIGYAQNLGASKTIITSITNNEGVVENTIYGIGTDIASVFTICPRMLIQLGKLTIAQEVQATRAAYGTINNCGRVINTDPVFDVRLLTSIYYFF